MTEYIKREDVLDALCNASVPTFNLFGKPILDVDYVPAIKSIPAADVVERKTGKWITYLEYGFVECPFCHSATNCYGDISELHYCFSCGAKLEGDDDD